VFHGVPLFCARSVCYVANIAATRILDDKICLYLCRHPQDGLASLISNQRLTYSVPTYRFGAGVSLPGFGTTFSELAGGTAVGRRVGIRFEACELLDELLRWKLEQVCR
jgi:hypothetical protein